MIPRAFDDILRDAYEAFETSAPQNLNVCTTCCMNAASERIMLTQPPCEISDAHIHEWLEAAFTNEVFPSKVCLYLAPRLMAAAATPDFPAEYELIFHRVPLGDPSHWTDAQNAIIRRYHQRYWNVYRQSDVLEPMLDDVLCMFAQAGFAIQDSLSALSAWDDTALINRLWRDCALHMDPPLWESVWWGHASDAKAAQMAQAHRTVQSWYASDALKRRIDTYLSTSPSDTNTWSRAAELEVALVRMRAKA